MIQLFKVPDYTIDTSKFKNLLHDDIKYETEQRIADYVGAKYCVGVSSCTAGIFLALKSLQKKVMCVVPTLITTRFLGSIIHSGNDYMFTDNDLWVGHDYTLYVNENGLYFTIIDSAQRFDPGQFKEYNDNDLCVFSNYPTKPLGGMLGGFVVSNDKTKIDWIRQAAYFGENFNVDSWDAVPAFVGWQLYMTAPQAYFIDESLKRYSEKRERLDWVRNEYNKELQSVTNSSYHLYRVKVTNNRKMMQKLKEKGIMSGIHYKCAHKSRIYGKTGFYDKSLEAEGTVLSIPFHEDLTQRNIDDIIKLINL